MSPLTEALEYISTWLQQHQPERSASLRPGLKYEEIKEKIKNLPFRLPTEVYELYQWRNGSKSSFILFPEISSYDYVQFFSLEEAIDNCLDWNAGLFPLFIIEDVGIFIVVDKKEKETSPVFSNDELSLPKKPNYETLTSMMIKLAEGLLTQE